jgi:muramoyltetrapeptide carboxypeptidase LdcA involved in peptidoglycan recycling
MGDGELEYLVRTGVKANGQYVPPWMPKQPRMADEDLHSIVAFLRSDDPMVAATEVQPAGHSRPNRALPLGTHVTLDATAGTLTIDEAVLV